MNCQQVPILVYLFVVKKPVSFCMKRFETTASQKCKLLRQIASLLKAYFNWLPGA
jgi:hypothetical protein